MFSGDQLQRIQSVSSGESVEFELRNVSMPAMWDDPVQRRLSAGGGRNSASSPAALQNWMSTTGLQSRTGQITVIGWTTGAPAPLNAIGGREVDKGRTGYVAAYPVALLETGESIGGASVRSRVVDLRWSEEFGGGGMVAVDRRGQFEGEVLTVVYDLPPRAANSDNLVVDIPRSVSAMDMWVGDGWVDAGIGVTEPGDTLLNLPDAAVVDGSVYLRVLMEPGLGPPTIRSATGAEVAGALNLPGGE